MRTPRFVFSRPSENLSSADLISAEARLSPEETRHLEKVLRLRPGDEVELHEPQTRRNYRARFVEIREGAAVTEILAELNSESSLHPIHLIAAVVSNEACDEIVQKSTEFGIRELTFLFSARSQKGARSEKLKERIPRFERLAISALKQSGAAAAPHIGLQESLESCLQACLDSRSDKLICLAPSQDDYPREITNLFKYLQGPPLPLEQERRNADFIVLIGPEGGWKAEEIRLATNSGFLPVSLGPTTLKTESAVVSVLALLTAFCSR